MAAMILLWHRRAGVGGSPLNRETPQIVTIPNLRFLTIIVDDTARDCQSQDGDTALTTFKLTGNCDEMCAQLKAGFEAREAQFKANLQAILKPQAPASAAKPQNASADWARDTKGVRLANRKDDISLRERLRTSLRVNPSR
jgi:hypothetical protein